MSVSVFPGGADAHAAALDSVMGASPVISVVVLDELEQAGSLAEILVGEGLPVIEVTLRTPIACAAIEAMAKVPGAIVGAGTVLNGADAARAVAAGAAFLVSPGLTADIVAAARALRTPILPGVATASEIMHGLELGLTRFKLFPAEAVGGVSLLRAVQGPFPGVRFCPTGGITPGNAGRYLELGNVACVGGSWIAPRGRFDGAVVRAAAADAHARFARAG